MPYRRSMRFKFPAARRGAASTIQRAWRKRKRRRRGGLVPRTALANRRAIKRLNRSVETNMIENVPATPVTLFGGQYFRPTAITNLGQDTAGNDVVWKPFRGMGKGVNSDQRTGDVITMKSLSYKIVCKSNATMVADTYNRVGCIIVLDTEPHQPIPANVASQPNLCNGSSGSPWNSVNGGTLMRGENGFTNADMSWLNMDRCSGPKKRFKVLKHHKCYLQYGGNGAYKPLHYFKGTLKYKYRIRYTKQDPTVAGTEINPDNQELLFFFYSDSTLVPHPTVSGTCRLRYKDA